MVNRHFNLSMHTWSKAWSQLNINTSCSIYLVFFHNSLLHAGQNIFQNRYITQWRLIRWAMGKIKGNWNMTYHSQRESLPQVHGKSQSDLEQSQTQTINILQAHKSSSTPVCWRCICSIHLILINQWRYLEIWLFRVPDHWISGTDLWVCLLRMCSDCYCYCLWPCTVLPFPFSFLLINADLFSINSAQCDASARSWQTFPAVASLTHWTSLIHLDAVLLPPYLELSTAGNNFL